MRLLLPALLCAALAASLTAPVSAHAQSGRDGTVTMFFRSEASNVLNALAKKAGANIVLPEDIKEVVTVRFNNVPVEEAIQEVAAQAGLVYRRVGRTFIVTKPTNMKTTLELVGQKETIPVSFIDPMAAATQLSKALPYLTVNAAGQSLLLTGAPIDISRANEVMRLIDTPPVAIPPSASSVQALSYSKAADVALAMSSVLPKLVIKEVTPSTVIFSGTETDVRQAEKLIKEFDVPPPTRTEYAVYHVKYANPISLRNSVQNLIKNINVVIGPDPFRVRDVQINLTTAQTIGQETGGGAQGTTGGTIGQGNTSQSDDEVTGARRGLAARTLVLGGTQEMIKTCLDILTKIDTPTPQVALDVKVVSANPETTQSLGVTWLTANAGQPTAQTAIAEELFESPNGTNATVPFGHFGTFGRLPVAFFPQLNIWMTRTDVRVLAKPTITALDDEDGVVFVGETRRVSVSSLVPNTGTSVVLNTIVEIPVGVILQMRPRVTEGDQIEMRVHPIYSSIDTTPAAAGLFNTFNREAETTVRVRSGETIVIAGLLQDEDTKTYNKVPIVGDIPLIGNLFRNHARDHLRREVMVFVTPHLLPD